MTDLIPKDVGSTDGYRKLAHNIIGYQLTHLDKRSVIA